MINLSTDKTNKSEIFLPPKDIDSIPDLDCINFTYPEEYYHWIFALPKRIVNHQALEHIISDFTLKIMLNLIIRKY